MHKPEAHRAGRLALALFATLFVSSLSAQVERPGIPPSRDARTSRRLTRSVPTERLGPVDVAQLQAEDRARPKGAPLRYGVVVPVDVALDESGVWEDLGETASGAAGKSEGRLWRQRVTSPGALSVGLVFRRFQLPVGAELYVYDASGEVVRGAYTHENHHPNGRFAVQPIPGDTVTLEYHEPEGVDVRGEIRLAAIVHDYRGVAALTQKAGSDTDKAVSCEIDVNCNQGRAWSDQIDSVLRVAAGGFLCSGALLNNTSQDGTQLFLSAEHCGDLDNAIFYFNYQRPGCNSGSAPTNQTVQGSLELARSSTYDCQLVRITEPIPDAYGAFLAGWDRSGSMEPNTIAIHHPLGGPKKISFDDESPQRSGSQWRILEWDQGVTEPGSSGSPLFSPDGSVIGQLCCGAAACGFPFDDYYGRLDSEWSLLSGHLDPGGTGALRQDGMTLVGSAPDPLQITGITPATVPPLIPGSAQTVTIEGLSFDSTTRVLVDAVVLGSSSYTVVDGETITFDMPQTLSLGSHLVTVVKNAEVISTTVDVAASSAPLLQVGSGDSFANNQVPSSAGLEVTVAGGVGELHYVLFSATNQPSTTPYVDLCLGNGFTSLELATIQTIGSAGWSRVTLPLPAVLVGLFLQSVTLDRGVPIPSSNCQEVQILP